VLRALVACGWFGIQTFIGGEAVKTFIEAVWPGFGELGGGLCLVTRIGLAVAHETRGHL
jgi:NCS1 family nucleobase:cation symporter-1